MPPLKDVLTKGLPKGYVPMEDPPTPPAVESKDQAHEASSVMRCPLPATNADADSIRMAQKGSSSPQFRILPLVPQTGGSTTVVTGGGISAASGSSSSLSASTQAAITAAVAAAVAAAAKTTVVAQTVSMTINVPANGATITRVTAAHSFQLVSISTNAPCDVRLYGTQSAQSTDTARQVDAPVPAELTQGIIIDVDFDTPPYFWGTENIVGVNTDSPLTTNLYVSVFNSNSAPLSNVSVYITYIPIEP